MNDSQLSPTATPAEPPAADPKVVRALLDRPFQVVGGKGGVGRTVVASAIALRSAVRGARTLLLEVNAPDGAARALEVPPSKDEPREVIQNLWHCRMTPAGALKEYALLILRFRALYNLVFENRLVKYLLRSIPSLAEFTLAGKTWYHATETHRDGGPRFHRVIVDAPATGHALTFLSVSRVVADTVPPGVMKNAAQRMASLFEAKDTSCLHLVSLPEEMPVNEALDLAAAARGRLEMALGLVFMNRLRSPLLHPGEAELLSRLAEDPQLAGYVDAASRRQDLEAMQAEHTARLAARAGCPLVRLPELPRGERPRELVHQLVEVLTEAAGD